MSTGYGWEGLRQVCATLLGARHVPERLCSGLGYLGRYNKCSPFLCHRHLPAAFLFNCCLLQLLSVLSNQPTFVELHLVRLRIKERTFGVAAFGVSGWMSFSPDHSIVAWKKVVVICLDQLANLYWILTVSKYCQYWWVMSFIVVLAF